MILSKQKILEAVSVGLIGIEPFDEALLKEASYSFRLAETIEIPAHGFVMVETLEQLTLPKQIACFLSVPGSLGQQGINALQSDIFAEPDTNQRLRLGISNSTDKLVLLNKYQPVVKGIFVRVE